MGQNGRKEGAQGQGNGVGKSMVAGPATPPGEESGRPLIPASPPGAWAQGEAVSEELLLDSGHHGLLINHYRQDGVGQLHGESEARRNWSAWKNERESFGTAFWTSLPGPWGAPGEGSLPLPSALGYFKN